MSAGWLERCIERAVDDRLYCIQPGCTTCGNHLFMRDVCEGVGARWSVRWWHDIASARAIARELRDFRASEYDTTDWESRKGQIQTVMREIVRNLIFRVCIALDEEEAAFRLGDSWAGRTLAGIQARRVREEAERKEQKRLVQERRAEKKRLIQERHQVRLAAKRERDRLWWAARGAERPIRDCQLGLA